MRSLMGLVTLFGATALLAPFALAVAAWLIARADRRDAWLWCACVAGVGAAIALLKIYFAACGLQIVDIRSASGHSAAAAMVYGGFTVIVMARSRSLRARVFRVAIAAWVVLIGISRVAVGEHTPGEVVLGLAIGCAGLLVFRHRYRGGARPPYALAGGALLVLALVALSLPAHGLTLEPWLLQLADLLAPHRRRLCIGG